jgi:hypothetical protein
MRSPRRRKPTLGPCWCPLGMTLSVGSPCSHFSYSCSDFERWCWGDRSRTSLTLIIHRPTTRLVTPSYLPLVASVRQGTPVPEESASKVREAPGADGTSLGAVSIEVDGACLWLGNDTNGLLCDWVMHNAGIGAPRSVAPGDVTPAPGSSGGGPGEGV